MSKEKLIKIQQKAFKDIETLYESLPFGADRKLAQDALGANKSILHRLGYRKPVKEKVKKPLRANPFKTRILTAGEKQIISKKQEIDNSGARNDAFKKADTKKVAKKIENKNVPAADKFTKRDDAVIATEETKKGKKKKTLTKPQKLEAWKMHDEEGKSLAEISDVLWVTHAPLKKFLKISNSKPKKQDNLLADNVKKDGVEDFIEEVKDSKK